jgi:hypothetical protein
VLSDFYFPHCLSVYGLLVGTPAEHCWVKSLSWWTLHAPEKLLKQAESFAWIAAEPLSTSNFQPFRVRTNIIVIPPSSFPGVGPQRHAMPSETYRSSQTQGNHFQEISARVAGSNAAISIPIAKLRNTPRQMNSVPRPKGCHRTNASGRPAPGLEDWKRDEYKCESNQQGRVENHHPTSRCGYVVRGHNPFRLSDFT